MLNMKKIISIFETPSETKSFTPSEISLTQSFIPAPKEAEDIGDIVNDSSAKLEFKEIDGKLSFSKTVVAIDSTAFMLGTVQDGVVAATRISVIVKEKDKNEHKMERYGPYVFMITNQNKQRIYQELFYEVYQKDTLQKRPTPDSSLVPDTHKMVDRIRNLLERLIQLHVIRQYNDSIILLDGSLIGDTVANPGDFIKTMIEDSFKNRNGLAAVSKFTNLTLRSNSRSILSLCENQITPQFVGAINELIDGNKSRYLGGIYVARLTKTGEVFRIDLPFKSSFSSHEIFSSLSAISGDYGYPEELKLAHTTSVFSSIEILELQAAAINGFHMDIEENLRKKLFAPF